jgi:hypothetical protein
MKLITIAAVLGMMTALVQPALAAPTPQDYERAIGLRAAWSGLTRDIAEPGQWVPDTHLYIYRKTVEGGFQFVMLDADTQTRRPAFDHDRLAAAFNLAAGTKTTGLALPFTAPFTTAVFSDGGKAVTIRANEVEWLCSLVAYTCAKPPASLKQDRGFSGVVRDLKTPADNTPHVSPDGKWLAFVENHNIAVMPAAGGAAIRLSTDGSEGLFYDPESIVWSPDSTKIAAYRVQPGYAREVVRVISSPADQVQPKIDTQLYVKPGDAVDIDRPVLFDVAAKRQIAVPYDLFPNPMRVTNLTWRKDSKALRFEYDQRGLPELALTSIRR